MNRAYSDRSRRHQPWLHVGVGDRESLAFPRQRVVVQRRRDGRVDVPAQRRQLAVGEELPEHGSAGVGRPADEPGVVQAVAVHAEPRVVHPGLAHQLDRHRRPQRRHRPPRLAGPSCKERRDAVRRPRADNTLLRKPCRIRNKLQIFS